MRNNLAVEVYYVIQWVSFFEVSYILQTITYAVTVIIFQSLQFTIQIVNVFVKSDSCLIKLILQCIEKSLYNKKEIISKRGGGRFG